MRSIALVAALLLASVAVAGTDGVYVMDGGTYSIDVRFGQGTLTVVEPNKTSVYRQSGSNEYLFTNPTNNVTYGLRVVDAATIQAFKPGPGNVPTTLRLRVQNKGAGPTLADADAAEAVAERYFELSQSDPVNAQTWTQCAAVAMIRATLPGDQAHEATMQGAMLLKMITTNRTTSPCPDAIPEPIWRSAPGG